MKIHSRAAHATTELNRPQRFGLISFRYHFNVRFRRETFNVRFRTWRRAYNIISIRYPRYNTRRKPVRVYYISTCPTVMKRLNRYRVKLLLSLLLLGMLPYIIVITYYYILAFYRSLHYAVQYETPWLLNCIVCI